MSGQTIGPYRVEERLGRGGMGTVYRAVRVDGAFEQTVALKVVRRDLASDLSARFHSERQGIGAGATQRYVRLLLQLYETRGDEEHAAEIRAHLKS